MSFIHLGSVCWVLTNKIHQLANRSNGLNPSAHLREPEHKTQTQGLREILLMNFQEREEMPFKRKLQAEKAIRKQVLRWRRELCVEQWEEQREKLRVQMGAE